MIPAINCLDFETLGKLVKEASRFLPARGGWIHIDVVNGTFAKNVTWGNPNDLASIKSAYPNINFEIHLMVANPEEVVESWFSAGAKRAIVHLETMSNPDFILDIANKYDGEVMLAVNPSTPADLLLPYADSFGYFQVLAVSPGLAGQRFKTESLDKISFLRQIAPDVKIEVDGGITPETARLAKIAGADILVAASYIFESKNPKQAYEELNGSIARK